ncbi:MAG: dTMP kinase [candidate division NC10 bacterium]|jgi:dTMP kinase|nr:dTMP kinase [candidate division NC10 bacterium]
MRGLFFTFEGVEGSGKTTQLRRLSATLRQAGQRVAETREPGGTSLGDAIRSILLATRNLEMVAETELFLYLASRAQLCREWIVPALNAETIVVCDRFADATVAYQGYGRGLDLKLIRTINRVATGGLTPDLTILLDLDPREGLRRVRERGQVPLPESLLDRLEAEALEFHDRVRKGYLQLAREEPHRFQIIDATQSEEAIAAEIWARVEPLIGSWTVQGGRR